MKPRTVSSESTPVKETLENVRRAGTCTGCGACVALDASGTSCMESTPRGPFPVFGSAARFPEWTLAACPGLGINYPGLYQAHYGRYPDRWLTGIIQRVRIGHAADPIVRRTGASGGVLSQVLIHLLETGRVDGVVLARQGVPTPEEARAVVATHREEILQGAQSVYVPVSMLDSLTALEPGKTYAMTCLPEQSAALRVLQENGFEPALRVRYVVGPYTGTALYPAALRGFLRASRVPDDDAITSLKWRAGEWPGYLEICTASGRVVRTSKVYYNFLIPFYITRTSLQSMDFSNEFAELAVGDGWSPQLESEGGGHSVVVTRSPEMEAIIAEMTEQGLLTASEEDPLAASDMHGHMLDFKKRGGYLRNRWRKMTGRMAPDYGYRPSHIPFARVAVEVIISTLFAIGGTRFARWVMTRIPSSIMGPLFNHTRLAWKRISRPTKRKGLADLDVDILEG